MNWIQLVTGELFELIVSIILLVGGLGIIASFVATMIPTIRPYRPFINLLSGILLIVGSYFQGGINERNEYQQKIDEIQKRLDDAVKKTEHINEEVDKKVNEKLNKLKGKVNENRKYIEKHKKIINSGCKLPDVARVLYNRAIDNEISGPTEKLNVTRTKPKKVRK